MSTIIVSELIENVRKWPCLYDVRHEHYRDKDERIKAWEAIGVELLPGFTDLPQDEKDGKVIQMKTKWRYTADYYKREKKEERITGFMKGGRHSHQLNFMDEVLEYNRVKKAGTLGLQIPYQENSKNNSDTAENYLIADDDEIVTFETYYKQEPSSPCSSLNIRSPEPVPKKRKADTLLSMPQTPDSADRYFLMSVLSEMSEMTEIEKMDLKMQILKSVKDIIDKR